MNIRRVALALMLVSGLCTDAEYQPYALSLIQKHAEVFSAAQEEAAEGSLCYHLLDSAEAEGHSADDIKAYCDSRNIEAIDCDGLINSLGEHPWTSEKVHEACGTAARSFARSAGALLQTTPIENAFGMLTNLTGRLKGFTAAFGGHVGSAEVSSHASSGNHSMAAQSDSQQLSENHTKLGLAPPTGAPEALVESNVSVQANVSVESNVSLNSNASLNTSANDTSSKHGKVGCFTPHSQYLPLNMPGQRRSKEPSGEACQKRCASVVGCAHFSWWTTDNGCHIQDTRAKLVTNFNARAVLAGPPACNNVSEATSLDVTNEALSTDMRVRKGEEKSAQKKDKKKADGKAKKSQAKIEEQSALNNLEKKHEESNEVRVNGTTVAEELAGTKEKKEQQTEEARDGQAEEAESVASEVENNNGKAAKKKKKKGAKEDKVAEAAVEKTVAAEIAEGPAKATSSKHGPAAKARGLMKGLASEFGVLKAHLAAERKETKKKTAKQTKDAKEDTSAEETAEAESEAVPGTAPNSALVGEVGFTFDALREELAASSQEGEAALAERMRGNSAALRRQRRNNSAAELVNQRLSAEVQALLEANAGLRTHAAELQEDNKALQATLQELGANVSLAEEFILENLAGGENDEEELGVLSELAEEDAENGASAEHERLLEEIAAAGGPGSNLALVGASEAGDGIEELQDSGEEAAAAWEAAHAGEENVRGLLERLNDGLEGSKRERSELEESMELQYKSDAEALTALNVDLSARRASLETKKDDLLALREKLQSAMARLEETNQSLSKATSGLMQFMKGLGGSEGS